MKKIMLATAAAFAMFAGAANADALSFGAYGEYAVEAQSVETGVSAVYVAGNGLEFGTEIVAIDTPAKSFDLDHMDLGVSYALNPQADVYGVVTLDSELEYSETVVGVAVKF